VRSAADSQATQILRQPYEMIWVTADEVIEGDRIRVGDSLELHTVTSVEPNHDVPGNILINYAGGTYEIAYERDVRIAPNPDMGECDVRPL
jgi:hypothetical protein